MTDELLNGERLVQVFSNAMDLFNEHRYDDAAREIAGPDQTPEQIARRLMDLSFVGAKTVAEALQASAESMEPDELRVEAAKSEFIDIDTEEPAMRTAVRLALASAADDDEMLASLIGAHAAEHGLFEKGGLNTVIQHLVARASDNPS